MTVTALIVEDHPLYREALAHLLRRIVGDAWGALASSAEEALRVAEAAPELSLILLAPGLPGMTGVEAIAAFRRACAKAAVIAISTSENRRATAAALRA